MSSDDHPQWSEETSGSRKGPLTSTLGTPVYSGPSEGQDKGPRTGSGFRKTNRHKRWLVREAKRTGLEVCCDCGSERTLSVRSFSFQGSGVGKLIYGGTEGRH